jgi:F0F1-type ATP synthase alpha subunit
LFESELRGFLESSHVGMLQAIREKKTLDDQLKTQVNTVIKEFKDRFVAKHKEAAVTA